MEIILSSNIKSLSGSLGQGFGYIISPQKDSDGNLRFFSQRSAHGAPKDGHLRFILACAELAKMGSHIADIKVSFRELNEAIEEATGYRIYTLCYEEGKILNAKQVLTLKKAYYL